MRNRAVFVGLLSVGLLLLGPGSIARADFVTPVETYSIPMTQTDFGPVLPGGKDPFVIHQFDPLGALLVKKAGFVAQLSAVELSLSYTMENQISFRFDNVSTETVSFSGQIHLYYNGTKTDVVAPATFSNSATLSSTPADVFKKYVTLPPVFKSGTLSSPVGGYIDATTLGRFRGTGSISIPVVATATSMFQSSSGNGFGSSYTAALATIRVFFHYTLVPVPEPSSMALLVIGGTGLGLVCRRRFRRED
jgi:hypothetical protein